MKMGIVLAAILMGGCARTGVQAPLSAEVPQFKDYPAEPTGYEGQKYQLVKVLQKSYAGCLPTDSRTVLSKPVCEKDQLGNFTGAGLTLADLYCDDFFTYANQASRRRNYTRGVFNDAGGAIAGILNLVKAGSDALTASSVGFAAIDSTFRNYDSSFMVDPDLSKLRQLVLAAQDKMKETIEAAPPKTLYAAESKVRRYASLCSFLGMKGLLDEALTRTTQDIAEQKTKPIAAPAPAPGGAAAPRPPAPAPGAAAAPPPPAMAPAAIDPNAIRQPLISTRVPPG